jgi:anthranilate/para-aminobenzoate synthase component II
MLLMIDNYDSFTYNLVQYFGELGAQVRVVRNDELSVDGDRCARARAHRHLAGTLHARTKPASRSR